MTVIIIIIIASMLVCLNAAIIKHNKPADHNKPFEIFRAPVARKYSVLYWFAGLRAVYDAAFTAWEFLIGHPWNKYTPRYVMQHHLHHSVSALQHQEKIIILVTTAVLVALYTYLVLTKRMRNAVTVLTVFLIWDVLRVLAEFTGSTPRMTFDVAVAGFTFLVLWSLKIRQPNFLKMLRRK